MNSILPKFTHPLYFFFLISFYKYYSQCFCILVCNFFASKHYWSRWENLDNGQYSFQPIKFVIVIVPCPCETKPHNNKNKNCNYNS